MDVLEVGGWGGHLEGGGVGIDGGLGGAELEVAELGRNLRVDTIYLILAAWHSWALTNSSPLKRTPR